MPAMSPDSQSATAIVDELIERCLKGDQQAWEQIVRLHWRKVFNVAYKFVGKHDEAEDLTQDIFLKIFKSLDTFDRRANFQTWLISVSRNLCIDHYRSVRKERETIDRDVDPGDLSPVSHEVSPYAALEQRDRVSLLREAMNELPESLRTAVRSVAGRCSRAPRSSTTRSACSSAAYGLTSCDVGDRSPGSTSRSIVSRSLRTLR